MATENNEYTIYAGNKHLLKFTITDSDNGGVAKDLTGIGAQFALSRRISDEIYSTTPVVEKDSDGPDVTIVAPASSGVIWVVLNGVDTEDLQGTYYYELETVDGQGNTLVVATGDLEIKANVSNV